VKWRLYAGREFPRVVLELGLRCAVSTHGLDTCPLHDKPVGATTRLCDVCFRRAWDEVAERYAAQGRPNRKETRR
jgi:hypothetical protein